MTLRIAVILVEFQDFRHYTGGTRPSGYFRADFDSMLFSRTSWYAPAESLQYSSRHPERDRLYGSFRNYWNQISRGRLQVQGTFINPLNANGTPQWMLLDHERLAYAYHVNWALLRNEAFQKAIDSNNINPSKWPDPRGYDKYIYIFAQTEPAQYAMTHGGDGTYIQCPERHGFQLKPVGPIAFAHIGVYAHEFGHNLGFHDEYDVPPCEIGLTDIFDFDLMAWGIYNGPQRKGECPGTLSPYYRSRQPWAWVIPDTLRRDTSNILVRYDYANPKYYVIIPPPRTSG